MWKTLPIIMVVLLGIAFISNADAVTKEKSMKVTGEIVSNDGRQMVVRGGPSSDQAFDVSAVKDIQSYRPGDNVTIEYKEKDGKIKESRIKKNTKEAG
jgi:hypothetical protein